MKIIGCWSDQLPKTSDGTDPLVIETERVLKGHCFFVFTANMIDETKTNRVIEVGIKDGSEYYPQVKRIAGTNSYSLQANIRHFVLKGGQQLYGKIHSPDSGDKCILNFSGVLFKE